MTDIPPIQGPGPHPGDAARRHERTAADADKFKQEMRRKQSQVGETDPEQQKKRKQQAEEEDEELPEPPEAPQSITPFEGKDLDKSPLAVKKGTSPLASSQPSPPSPYRSQSLVATSATPTEEFPAPQAPASPSTPSTPAITTPSTSPSTASSTTPTSPQIQRPPPSQSTSSQPPKEDNQKQQESGQESSPSTTPTTGPTPSFEETGVPSEDDIPVSAEELAEPSPPSSTLPAPQTETTSEAVMEELLEGMTQPTPSSGSESKDHSSKEEKEKEAPILSNIGGGGVPPPPLSTTVDTSTSPPPTPYMNLSSQVLDLFERMVGVMTVMTDAKMTETTMTLTSSKFAASIFYGTQIIIREYSSAPKVFNIQLNGNPEAVTLFKGNADALMAAFQNGNYQFRVHRLDTGLLSGRPLFRRKEKISGDPQEDHPETGS